MLDPLPQKKYVATKGGDGLLGNGGYMLVLWQSLKSCHFLNISWAWILKSYL